jgi:3-hydroxyacyl-CoA dehydrogenase
MRKRKAAIRDRRERYVPIADLLRSMGRLGRKAGAGWYDYSAGISTRGKTDPVVTEIVRAEARKHGKPRTLSKQEIQHRALGAIINEAAHAVEQGVARSGAEVDLVVVNGYGFSKLRGGPLFLASRMSNAEVEAIIDAVAQATGFGFRRGNVIPLLDTIRT